MRLFLAYALFLATPFAGLPPTHAATPPTDVWPQWRGPDGQGHANVSGLPLKWSETENILWKTPLPGRGHSSPVIASGRVWLTTAFETPAKPEDIERRKKADTSGQPLIILAEVRLHALCLESSTGRVRHNIELFRENDPQWVHQQNTFADDRLYFHDRDGVTSVVKPGPKFEILARNTLEGSHMASAAAAEGHLFLRTDRALYCIGTPTP